MFKRILILFLVFSAVSCNSDPSFSKARNLDEAKIAAKFFVENWKDTYSELCNKDRSQDLKYEFLQLAATIGTAWDAHSFCKNLNENEKNEAQEYILELLYEEQDLIDLYNSKTNCW